MKAKVIKTFKDKYNGKLHKAGDTVYVNKTRFAEINKKDKFVEAIEETKAEDPAKK
jgi:hypothetical protein